MGIDAIMSELEQLIAKRPIRQAVYEAAMTSEGAFTSVELYERVRQKFPRTPRATFFRALRFLHEKGLLRRAALQGGGCVYQRASDSRTILWVCDDCSQVQALEATGVAEALREVANRCGLKSDEMTVEVHSRCGCRH